MDEVPIRKAQLKTLTQLNTDVVITQTNQDAGMIYVERTKYRGNAGEGQWMLNDGSWRDRAPVRHRR